MMITADYIRTMAAYMAWQNRNVFDAANGLSEAERQQDRGSFFGSIHGTLSHLLWGDRIWMHRLAQFDPPEQKSIPASVMEGGHWDELMAARLDFDLRIKAHAETMTDQDLSGEFSWLSGATGRKETVTLATAWMHVFNHQTHHRGQVHAMLTAAGARPGDTDLVFMPR